MTIATLKDRLEKAEERISKKTYTIAKKEALIEKKTALMESSTDEFDKRWKKSEIEILRSDIVGLQRNIEKDYKKIEEYKLQMAEVMKQEKMLTELPEVLKKMQAELVERWDEWDKEEKERLLDEYNEIGYREFLKSHSDSEYELMYKTLEEIHLSNLKDAKDLILNLVYRVKYVVGDITSWKGIRATQGTQGFTVLNGYVEGSQGKAVVESILAGGYNIQRLHVRVLVKRIK